MPRLTTLPVALALLLPALAGAQAGTPVDIQPGKWVPQSQQPADGKAVVSPESFTLTRGAAGGGPYMLRVTYDLPAQPGGVYVFSYRVKVEGPGSAFGLVFGGDRAGKWDEPGATNTETQKQCDFTPVKTIVVASQDTVKFRLDLRAGGADTTVTYRDVSLLQVGSQPPLLVSPAAGAVTLDGRLDDPLWTEALKLTPFRVLGNIVTPAAVANEALVAIKDGYLYVGYRLQEPQVKSLKTTRPERPDGTAPLTVYADDCTETFLSTDQVAYSHVIVNAAGARHWDQQNIGQPSPTWYPSTFAGYSGEWDAKAAVGKGEWSCELRVRLRDLYGREVGGDQKLFVNFTRHRTVGTEENLTWAPINGLFYAVPRQFVPLTLKLPPATGPSTPQALAGRFTRRFGVPDLLLAGAPVKLVRGQGVLKLGGAASRTQKAVALDAGVCDDLVRALGRGPGTCAVVLQTGDPAAGGPLSAAEKSKLKSPEAFRLQVQPERVTITGRTREGVLRGIATFILMANRARCSGGVSLPALTLYDAPRLPFRGLMVKLSKRVIDVAFLLRMNKLLVYLDSFGGPTIFPFECYPIGGNSTTKQELVELFAYARARGIEPIPYFASWGRTQYLKVMPGGVDLLVDDLNVLQQGYRNLDVARPETHKVMLALQQEIIDTLHPQSFCIAMDEAHFGNMVTSAAARARGWKPSDWYAEALNINAAFLRKQGLRMYIWGDMIEPTHNGKALDMCGPELLARLPKDMTILDWEYSGQKDVTDDYPSIAMFREAGLPTIGCPWYAPKSVPRLARSIAAHGGQGLLLTAWNSSAPETMPAEWIRACALTAWYSWSPEDCDPAHLSFLPDAIMQGAAYWSRPGTPAGTVTPVPVSGDLTAGEELLALLGLPAGTDTAFLGTPFANYRGVKPQVLRRDGRPAALVLRGRAFAYLRNGDFTSGLAGWSLDGQADDTQFVAEDGVLRATRVSGNAYRRLYRDLRLEAARQYKVTYRVKVQGPGAARAWTYSGTEDFKWDESKCVFSGAGAGDWASREMLLPKGFAALRVCLSVDGPGTTAWYDDVKVVEVGGDPAAAVPDSVTIPLNAPATVLTFFHATSRQVIAAEDMPGNTKRFASLSPGEYVVTYADGSSETIPLVYRRNIVAANDPNLGQETDLGLFGTVGDRLLLNLPTFTWVNPHPEKTIREVVARAGNSAEMSLLLLGLARE